MVSLHPRTVLVCLLSVSSSSFRFLRCSLSCRRRIPKRRSSFITASWQELVGVLLFSAIPFTTVKAIANSPLGQSLQRKMEETNKFAVENSSTFKALADQAPKESFWYGEDRLCWLGHIAYKLHKYPSYLTGELPGDYGFDISGLGQDPVALQKYFNFEILHARWVMLASVGVLIPEILDLLGAFHFVEHVWRVGYSKLKFGSEYARYCGIEALELVGIYLPGEINYPGGALFDPLDLSNDPEAFKELKVKEIKKWTPGNGCLVRLIDHISDLFHNNLLSSLNFIKLVM